MRSPVTLAYPTAQRKRVTTMDLWGYEARLSVFIYASDVSGGYRNGPNSRDVTEAVHQSL